MGQVAPSTMGNSTSGQTVSQAVKDLLKVKGIGLKKERLEKFLKVVDQVAPWFSVSGLLTGLRWEKLGKNLKFAEEQGVLAKGVLPVWKLIQDCIKDKERCGAELQKGNEALNQVREEHSQLVWERGSVCVYPGSPTTAVGPRTADQSNSKQAEL